MRTSLPLLLSALILCAQASAAPNVAASDAVASDQNVRYVRNAAPIYSDAALQDPIGTMLPGTRLSLSSSADATGRAFVFEGWTEQGDETDLFVAPGQRIVAARLRGESPALARGKKTQDPYGNTWVSVKLVGYIAAASLAKHEATVWAGAATLYQTRCTACHALHRPDEFSANQWPSILHTMAKNAALQPPEIELLTQYLQTHAKH